MIQASDISFVYSGGSSNNNPNLSIGGNPSSHPIIGTLNNLFDDVEDDEPEDGFIDYRCFYLFNDSATDSLYESKIYFSNQVSGGASVQMGVTVSTDSQIISVIGNPTTTGGDATMAYEGDTFVWTHDADDATWGGNLESGLNGLDSLSGVSVSTSVTNIDGTTTTKFIVTFGGDDDNRNHQLIQLVNNNFTPSGVSIPIAKITNGAPINSIAPSIAIDTVPPTNVEFHSSTSASPIVIGVLAPGDGVPVWIKRTTPADSSPLQNDGFTFRLNGKPFI